jgi:rod shape-determining protein MreB
MLGRTSEALEVVMPIRDGVIADLPLTLAMLREFMRRAGGKTWFRKLRRPEFAVSVPYGIDNVKRRAIENTTAQMGGGKVVTVEEPLAAALGSGIPVEEPVGSMVVGIGGGSTQAAILSLGGLVVGHTMLRGGDYIDEMIVDYVKNTYNMTIGRRTAEQVKRTIGTAVSPEPSTKMDIRGRSLVNGLPTGLQLRAEELYELLQDFIRNLVDSVRICLEQCPPELVGDILERGIVLCGGGAMLNGIDRRLQLETKVPVVIADRPLDCVALGVGQMLR